MLTGKFASFNGPAIVAFVDLLGFSKEVTSNWGRAINDPLRKLLEIRSRAEQSSRNPLHTIGVEGKILVQGVVSIMTLSDSFVLLHGIELKQSEIKYVNFINGLFSACAAIRTIWSKSIELGFTVRGAITLNEIYWDKESNIVGPGLIEAYNLERKEAKVSRIIISAQVNRMLFEFTRDIKDRTFHNEVAQRFIKDEDGWIIVDPRYALSRVQDPIASVRKMMHSITDPYLRAKYSSLEHNLARTDGIDIPEFGKY